MKKRYVSIITICGIFTLLLGGLFLIAGKAPQSEEDALEEILALEREAYVTWFQSDPTAYAQGFADKATYFDTWLPDRFDDAAVKEHLMTFVGKIPNFDYEFINPRVDLYGDTAVFTFNLEAYNPTDGTVTARWKSTAVLNRTKDGWEKVHAHWTPIDLGI
jgi:hypothetical protein